MHAVELQEGESCRITWAENTHLGAENELGLRGLYAKKGKGESITTGQLNHSTGRGVSREREWLRKEKVGETMGEA